MKTMNERSAHTRRDFLRGKAAARTLADKVMEVIDQTVTVLNPPSPAAKIAHLEASRRAMACEFSIRYHAGSDATECVIEAFDKIDAIEALLTIYRDQSQVIEINRSAGGKPIEIDDALTGLISLASRLHAETNGAFDITCTPLSRCWGFLQRQGRRPSDEAIAEAHQRVGFGGVHLDLQTSIIALDERVEINFNSMGKGYALEQAALLLKSHGIDDFLWQAGGSSILARGRNLADRRDCWTLGLRHPLDTQQRIAELHLRDRALATAGGGTQFFEYEGRQLGHIVDPRTGWPAEGVYTSTVVAPTATEADALATAFYVMKLDEVASYCDFHPEIGALIVTPSEEPNRIAVHGFGLSDEDLSLLVE